MPRNFRETIANICAYCYDLSERPEWSAHAHRLRRIAWLLHFHPSEDNAHAVLRQLSVIGQ